MERTTLGTTGIQVSRYCLGAMMFGAWGNRDHDESVDVIHAALAAGINFIDTADVYSAGESEAIVAKALQGRRDDVVLATKVHGGMGDDPNMRGNSRRWIMRECEESLRRLDTDYIDLYQCHFPDADTPIEETMATLDGFVKAGKVRYIGCSNFSGGQIVEAQWAAERISGTPFVSLQPRYSLIARDIETDILPTCERQGVGTLVYSPLGGGVLTGKYRRGEAPGADTRFGRQSQMRPSMAQIPERQLDVADAVGKIAAELGATPTAVALAWVLGRRNVTSVIIGPRTLDQYRENAAAFTLELPADAVSTLNAVSKAAR